MENIQPQLTLTGLWFDKGSSRSSQAHLTVFNDEHIEIHDMQDQHIIFSSDVADMTIPSRLGNTARNLYFVEGQKFETSDNDQIDKWLRTQSGYHLSKLIYRLETHWRLVLFALLLLVGFVWGSIQYGIPLLAEGIAFNLPNSVAKQAGEQSLKVLDKSFFEPSQLTTERKAEIRALFNTEFNTEQSEKYHLLFRSSEGLGANAMALPDGTIVMTDDMVNLAAKDAELMAVLAHEVGHVVYKHGLRGIVQNSVVVFLTMALTGDSSGVAELFVGLPLLLVQNAYSRDFEREADGYAHDFMLNRHLALADFSHILDRVALSAQCQQYLQSKQGLAETMLNAEDCRSAAGLKHFHPEHLTVEESVPAQKWQNYLSTHPSNDERRALFQ